MIIVELEEIIVNELKKIYSSFSKPLQWIISIATTGCGLNILSIILVCASIVAKRDFFEEHYKPIISVLIVMILLLILGLLFISTTLCVEILRMKPFREDFDINLDNCTKNCTLMQESLTSEQRCVEEIKKANCCIEASIKIFTQQLHDLDDVIINRKIAGRIINTKRLMEIEGNIPSGSEIIIFSSKYKIDKEYKPLIINNIRKGVTYKYIVSGVKQSSYSHLQFIKVVKSWYDCYQALTQNERVYGGKKKGAKNFLPTTKHNLTVSEEEFFACVKEFCSPFAHDTLTVMLYQKEPGSNTYQVIVNLPADKGETYSYILPENHTETNMIIQGIISICSEDNEYNYRGGIQ